MSNSKIPKKLAERQAQQRQETINLVLRAINGLNNEGHKISIKLLMEYTGLSRSVFAKQHIRDILVKNDIVKNENKINSTKPKSSKEERLKEKIQVQDNTIKRLKEKNEELKKECELLRGRIFLLMQK